MFHCCLPAVTGNVCDNLMKLPEQTVSRDVICLPSMEIVVVTGTERAEARDGRVQIHFRGG